MFSATVTGNIGKNAELRQTQGGNSVLSFSVASNSKERGAEVTTWFDCSLWGPRGEKLAQHLTRGTKVAVSGRGGTREHNGKTYLTIQVSELDFMGGGQRREQSQDTHGQHDSPQPNDSPDDDFGDAF